MAGAAAAETAQLLGGTGTGSGLDPVLPLGGSGSRGGPGGRSPVTVGDGRPRVGAPAHSDGHGGERGSAVHVSRLKPAETAARTSNTVLGRSGQEGGEAGGPAGRERSSHTHQVFPHPASDASMSRVRGVVQGSSCPSLHPPHCRVRALGTASQVKKHECRPCIMRVHVARACVAFVFLSCKRGGVRGHHSQTTRMDCRVGCEHGALFASQAPDRNRSTKI